MMSEKRMGVTMYTITGAFKEKILLLAIVVAASAIMLMPLSGDTADAAGEQYFDTSGNMVNFPAGVIELNGTETNLTGSGVWYYAKNNLNYVSTINVIGSVNLIIADDTTMRSPINITTGSSLAIYPQSDPMDSHAGKLTWVGEVVRVNNTGLTQTSLLNVAVITNEGVVDPFGSIKAVQAVSDGPSSVTNYGIIHGASSAVWFDRSNGNLYNYGKIIADSWYGVYCPTNLINEGYISSNGDVCISLSWSSRVENSGTIIGAQTALTTTMGNHTIINHPGGLIEGGTRGIGATPPDWTSVENYGKIVARTGDAVYMVNYLINANEIVGGIEFHNSPAPRFTVVAGSTVDGRLKMNTNPAAKIIFTGIPTGTPLTYTTVTGPIDLGNAEVSIDDIGWTPPPTLRAGQIIVLIDGTGTSVTNPVNSTITALGYTFPLYVKDGNQLVILVKKYEISLTDADTGATLDDVNPFDFDPANPGYTPQVLNVQVTNSGNMGAGTGELSISIAGPDAAVFGLSVTSLASIPEGAFSIFTVTPDAALPIGTYTATITVGKAAGNPNPIDSISFDITFVVSPDPVIREKEYFITATSDDGSVISPSGVVTVLYAKSKTFIFSAKSGYSISMVLVDGVPLSSAVVSTGKYTFLSVNSNHTIEVRSVSGYGGGDDKGGDGSDDEPSDDVGGDGKNSILWWILLLAALLLLVGFLIWFFLYYRRRYDVIKVAHNVNIVGKDRVRRKGSYSFTIDGAFSGTVSYKIGEEGTWKPITPGNDGVFTIPRGEITDDVTIEVR